MIVNAHIDAHRVDIRHGIARQSRRGFGVKRCCPTDLHEFMAKSPNLHAFLSRLA
jgi:hypothetical protein